MAAILARALIMACILVLVLALLPFVTAKAIWEHYRESPSS